MKRGLLLALLFLQLASFVLAAPVGPDTISTINSTRRTEATPISLSAIAGNVTEINIVGTSVTGFWQGYYGNVSGTISLADSANNSLYKWNVANPGGEIYASRNSSLNWSNLRCANTTEIQTEDTFLGANSSGSPDSVNNTFNSTTFRSFYAGFLNFTTGSCRSTSVNGTGTGSMFYETLLMDKFNDSGVNQLDKFIYTAIIDQNQLGFDQRIHDFQMLVGEPGTGAETYPNGTASTYYFWVELQ